MIKYFQILIFLLFIVQNVSAQIDPEIDARLQRRDHTFQSLALPYRLYVPDGYSETEKYPLLLFLHGANWAGTDNVTQLDNELAQFWIDSTRQAQQPCFVVYPQIPSGHRWEYTSGQVYDLPVSPELVTVNDMLTTLFQEFAIDTDRIYMCGKSIGALGVYGILARYPERFAAAIPAAGYHLYRTVGELTNSALWIFHNRIDMSVPVQESRELVAVLQNAGYPVVHTHCKFYESCDPISADSMDTVLQNGNRFIYSEFDDTGHQLEPNVVSAYGLYEWTMAQLKTGAQVQKRIVQPFLCSLSSFPNPFNAETIIHFTLEKSVEVEVIILNSVGQFVIRFEFGEKSGGEHTVHWNGTNHAGQIVSSGLYLCCLRIGDVLYTDKLLFLR